MIEETEINKADYKSCLNYIEKYWAKITCYHPNDHFRHLGLPNKFISPNADIYKNDQFYWDSYFTILGLVKCGRTELAKGMVENFIYLFKRFNIMPMRNRFYNLGGSQMPFFSSMCREVFTHTNDLVWFKKVMKVAEEELSSYWMNKSLTEKHLVYQGLSRYCDHFITHLAAEHESGWDMTSRFHSHCLDYLPVDLNCALYKYETDLAEFYKLTKNKKKSEEYIKQSEVRRKKMNKLMWNDKKGFYFDYEYLHTRQSTFWSVAGFYPLWAKMATYTQAKKLADNISRFEHDGGITNTRNIGLDDEFKQHDYPNGWPHQHWIVIKGLMNYGFTALAKRIAKKYLDLNKILFVQTGKMWEKHDVVKCKIGLADRYETQYGFGWTNAVFVRLIDKFGK
ncbi:MAG: trehalase family glycosidase [Bacteroidota bacterium]